MAVLQQKSVVQDIEGKIKEKAEVEQKITREQRLQRLVAGIPVGRGTKRYTSTRYSGTAAVGSAGSASNMDSNKERLKMRAMLRSRFTYTGRSALPGAQAGGSRGMNMPRPSSGIANKAGKASTAAELRKMMRGSSARGTRLQRLVNGAPVAERTTRSRRKTTVAQSPKFTKLRRTTGRSRRLGRMVF